MAKKQQHGEAPRVPEFSSLFTWPAMMAASVGEAIAASFAAPGEESGAADAPQPVWTTPHRLHLELGTMALRDFSTGEGGVGALICAPFALHYATMARRKRTIGIMARMIPMIRNSRRLAAPTKDRPPCAQWYSTGLARRW